MRKIPFVLLGMVLMVSLVFAGCGGNTETTETVCADKECNANCLKDPAYAGGAGKCFSGECTCLFDFQKDDQCSSDNDCSSMICPTGKKGHCGLATSGSSTLGCYCVNG